MAAALSSAVAGAAVSVSLPLPLLELDGFSWAEQLVFDGRGNMFVSEAVRGELWRISLCEGGGSSVVNSGSGSGAYCSEVYLTEGFDQFGGLAVTPDGLTLYAGVTLADDSKALISVSTTGNATYSIVTQTTHQPNGLQGDFARNMLYYTDEGTGSEEGGTLRSINLDTATESIVKDHIDMADGLWYDVKTDLMYVGWLLSMEISVFSLSSGVPVLVQDKFPGCASLDNVKHMLDDLTLVSTNADMGQTVLLGADWTGRAIQLFSLDGSSISTIDMPEGVSLKEPTSVRWGQGPGFDPQSIYVTEGGGATARQTNRRVIQIPMHDFFKQ